MQALSPGPSGSGSYCPQALAKPHCPPEGFVPRCIRGSGAAREASLLPPFLQMRMLIVCLRSHQGSGPALTEKLWHRASCAPEAPGTSHRRTWPGNRTPRRDVKGSLTDSPESALLGFHC